MKKKLMALTLALTCLMSFNGIAFANDDVDIDADLLERGYPQVVLDNMCEENKMEIYNDSELSYAGATLIQYSEDTGETNVIDVDSQIAPIGQIPAADLSILLTPSGKTSNGKLQSINCTLDYEWTKVPFNRYQDPITVTIDSTDYRIDYDSFKKVDKYVYRDYNNQRKTKTKSSETTAAEIKKHGVSWYADLAGGVVDELYGYGKFTINADNPTASGSMDINFMYAHAKSTGTVIIPIPKIGGSLSVSGGGSSDQLGGGKYVKWSNGNIR